MVKWSDFVGWIFFGLLSYFAYDMNSTMKEMSLSVIQLNQSVAVMVFQGNLHEDRIKYLEEKVFKK